MNSLFAPAVCENVTERKGHIFKTPPPRRVGHVIKNDMDVSSGEILSSTDYYAFGMQMPGRNFSSPSYRFGFNGQEKDDEVYGTTGAAYTAEFWEYDARIGRRWNRDAVVKPWEGSYTTFSNNPIWFSDPTGLDTTIEGKIYSGVQYIMNGQISNESFLEQDMALGVVTVTPQTETAIETKQTLNTPPKAETSTSSANANVSTSSPLLEQSYQGSLVAQFSTSQTGKFKYNYGSPARPFTTINATEGQTQFDCSAWVYYCLSQYYPGLASAIGTNTSSIRTYALQYGGIRNTNPKVGDLVLWVGHVEIVTSVQGETFQTSGASGKSGAAIPSPKSFSGINDQKIKWYGNGTFLGFWTPQFPTPKL